MLIQKNWQELIKPNRVDVSTNKDPSRFGTIVVEPLERGYGLTLGNALRRVLLSSLQGAAVTAIRIDGVLHEFSSIPGVREDVTDIVLNIKGLSIRMHAEGSKKLRLNAEGPCEVTAGMIEQTADVEIVNPDLVICTLGDKVKLGMELTVSTGKGYRPAAQNRHEDAPIGIIPVDSIFSPVRKVSYKVEDTRVGQITDYDKLSLDLETNGTVRPEDAVAYAARILQDQLQAFVNFQEPTAVAKEESKDELPFSRHLLRK
ncbi:MAG: DNA-directed RNA polymerase subunit alpha, partial [Alphaproteobacteria bacterium]|nr:DNA-directed RNA polymerase subunit alpha [Alphaproteobacteria bacterium]